MQQTTSFFFDIIIYVIRTLFFKNFCYHIIGERRVDSEAMAMAGFQHIPQILTHPE